MTLWIFSANTSPSAPPKTVKSWLNTHTLRPSMVPKPVITPSVYGPVLLEAHPVGPVAGQHVELLEGAVVEQVVDALAGGHLPLGVVLLDRPGRPGVAGLLAALGQFLESLGHRVIHWQRGYPTGARVASLFGPLFGSPRSGGPWCVDPVGPTRHVGRPGSDRRPSR